MMPFHAIHGAINESCSYTNPPVFDVAMSIMFCLCTMNGGIHSWEMSGKAPFVIDVNMAFVFSVFRW